MSDRHDELLRLYLEEIAAQPALSPEEEDRLGRLAHTGDGEASSALVRGNLRLVVAIARRYAATGIPMLDLVQEGNLGLLRAVEAFDPDRGFAFRTAAMWWVRQAIAAAIADHAARSEGSPDVVGARLQDAWDGFVAHHGRQPSIAELAADLGVGEDEIRKLLSPDWPKP